MASWTYYDFIMMGLFSESDSYANKSVHEWQNGCLVCSKTIIHHQCCLLSRPCLATPTHASHGNRRPIVAIGRRSLVSARRQRPRTLRVVRLVGVDRRFASQISNLVDLLHDLNSRCPLPFLSPSLSLSLELSVIAVSSRDLVQDATRGHLRGNGRGDCRGVFR